MTQEPAEFPKTIFAGEHVTVRYSDFGSATCFVTFTPWGKFDTGFGQNLLQSRKCSAIYFISKWDHWYQPEEVRQSIALARKMVDNSSASKVITYGSSMGAYAAAIYSKALNAEQAILIAPQFSINDAKVPFERRWRAEAERIEFLFDDMDAEISPTTRKTILFDPWSSDAKHALLYAGYPNTDLIRMPFSGHHPAQVLLQAGMLQDLIFDLESGQFDRNAFFRRLHLGRRKSPYYWNSITEHALPGRPKLALCSSLQAVLRAPRDLALRLKYIELLIQEGRLLEVCTRAREATDLAPDHPAPWRAYSIAALRLGKVEEAIDAAAKAVALREGDADLHRVLLDALMKQGNYAKAVLIAERATQLDPKRVQTFALLAKAYEHCGRLEDAADAVVRATMLDPANSNWKEEAGRLAAMVDNAARLPTQTKSINLNDA